MIQSNTDHRLDLERTRANLRHMAAAASFQAAKPYRDRDLLSPPATQNNVLADIANFEDLDDQPLPSSAESESDDSPRVTQSPALVDTPDRVSGAGAQDTVVDLTPAVMRRILLVATTADGVAPAFSRAQANIGERGLCFGIGRFCQADGGLGRYLTLCQDEDPEAFERLFGPDDDLPQASTAALLDVLNSTSEDARKADVGGKLLWSRDWIARFKQAGEHVPFQDMQFLAMAIEYLVPLLPLARKYALNTERALALCIDRAVLMGSEAASVLIDEVLTANTDLHLQIATLAGVAAASPLPGRAAALATATGLGDRPLSLAEPILG